MSNILSKQYYTGIIYKLTFPNGKSYIGQTIYTLDHRVKQHIQGSRLKIGGCRNLYNAIRKYGENSFKSEVILHYCSISSLDTWERLAIKYYNTLAPNGYNLTTGGQTNKIMSNETRQRFIDRDTKIYRTSSITENLPKYILYINNKDRKGYRIDRHPLCRSKYFCNPKYTLDENLQLCIKYVKDIDNGLITHNTRINHDLPKGIQKCGKGYRVLYKNHIKTFRGGNVSSEIKLSYAIKCLKEFHEKYK